MGRSLLSTLLALLLAAGSAWAAEHAGHVPAAGAKPDRNAAWRNTLAKPSLAVAAAFGADGRLWLVSSRERHLYLQHSDDLGRSFGPPVRLNAEPEDILGDGENRPKLVVRGDALLISYTRGLAQPMTGDIRLIRSVDGGRSFLPPQTINDNRDVISHRFDALVAGSDGRVALAWLDKRDLHAAQVADRPYKGAAVYVAESRDGGQTFAANRKLADHSCECCRVAMAADRDGTPVAFWRHIFDGGIRDFAIARLDENARRATEDGWRIDACPHHGGSIAVDTQGGRHLAWFTGAEGKAGLYYRRLGSAHATAPLPFGNPDAQAGHPAVLALGDSVVLAWSEYDGRQTRIRTMTSPDRGDTWSPPATRAATTGAADYPLLLEGRDAAWLAWNTAAEGFRLFPLEGAK